MKLPRNKQKYPEQWLWDYSENKFESGFGVVIAYPDGKVEVLHFNDRWINESDFHGSFTKRDDLLEISKDVDLGRFQFVFDCELK